jgi:hypothetical protein
MSGERNLDALRSGMSPSVHEQAFVYCSVRGAIPAELEAICTFKEHEGWTAIAPRERAEALGLEHQFECTMITLDVHSALDAVGFIAVVSGALAKEGIPCNVVSAYYHDHLFVPTSQRDRVMNVLRSVALPSESGVDQPIASRT